MILPEKIKTLEAPMPTPVPAAVVLDANESYIDPPLWLEQAMLEVVARTDLKRYPDPMAAELCEAAASYYGVATENMTAGCGSDELISVLVTALIPQEGRLLLSEPDFGMYRFYAELREVVCVNAPRQGGALDMEALLAEAQDGDCIIFSNPCNPTGQGITAERLLEFVQKAPCLVVADEAYMDFWDQSLAGAVRRLDNLIVLRTASKACGLAGLRLGFALAGERLTDILRAAKSPYNVSTLTQRLGTLFFRHPDYLRECAEQLRESARQLYRSLDRLTESSEDYAVTATLTNFVLLTCPEPQVLYEGLLAKGIRVRRLKTALRITGGTEEENAAVLSALRELML